MLINLSTISTSTKGVAISVSCMNYGAKKQYYVVIAAEI